MLANLSSVVYKTILGLVPRTLNPSPVRIKHTLCSDVGMFGERVHSNSGVPTQAQVNLVPRGRLGAMLPR